MPETNQSGAKPTPTAPQFAPNNRPSLEQERRDKFYLVIAGAILGRQSGRSPSALARECRDYTDAFIAALDAPRGA